MERKIVIGVAVIMMLSWIPGSLKAQSSITTPDRYYAFSLYNFTRYVKWPEKMENRNFEIAIVGSKSVYDELVVLTANRKWGKHLFKVHYYKNHEEMTGAYHMVYLSSFQSGAIDKIDQKIDATHTMFVTEREGMGPYGSGVCFLVNDEGKIAFEVIDENLVSRDLHVSSQLKTLARK